MAAHAGSGCAGGLVDVDLLDGLAGGVFVASPDGVVEDYYFFDAREFGAQEGFDFGVVAVAHGGVVGEEFFLRWVVVDGEAGVVGCEVGLLVADVVESALVVFKLEGSSWAVDFAPWFARVGRLVYVSEDGGCHCAGLVVANA